MRPTVTYENWSCWGKIGLPRHECSYRKNSNRASTCKVYVTKTKEVHVCTYCGTYMPLRVEEYFERIHKLLTISEM